MTGQGWFDGALVQPALPGLEATLARVSGWQALSITDSPQTMELRIVNRMPVALTASPATLRVLFRPGILTMVEDIVLAPQSDLAWLLGIRLPTPEQMQRDIVMDLVGVDTFTVAPGESFAIRLNGVSADPTGGSRATRVQLDYRGFFRDPDTEIGGTEVMHLPVLRRHELSGASPTALRSASTATSGPFLAGYLDGADLLNDGKAENELTIRIVNASGRPVALSGDADWPTRFVLSFHTGTEKLRWGLLGVRTDHLAVTEAQPGWQIDHYTIRRTEDGILTPGEYLDLQLVVYTTATIGDAQLIITCENLPDFDDGDLVLLAHVGPLAVRNDEVEVLNKLIVDGDLAVKGEIEGDVAVKGKVTSETSECTDLRVSGNVVVCGRGTSPGATADRGFSLTVCGRKSAVGSELIGFNTAAGELKWHVNIVETGGGKPGGLNFVETGKADYRLFLAHGGNVGIGTETPNANVHVVADPGVTAGLRLTSQPVATKEAPVCAVYFDAVGISGQSYIGAQGPEMFVVAKEAGSLEISTGDGSNAVLIWQKGSVEVSGSAQIDGSLKVLGNTEIDGVLHTTAKNFAIPHPLRPEERLLHGCLEGPEAGVYYRGEGMLESGTAVVRLPDYFEALTRPEDRTVQLTAKGTEPFLLSYEAVANGRFTVHGSNPSGRFAWEVRAVRADIPRLAVEPGRGGTGSIP